MKQNSYALRTVLLLLLAVLAVAAIATEASAQCFGGICRPAPVATYAPMRCADGVCWPGLPMQAAVQQAPQAPLVWTFATASPQPVAPATYPAQIGRTYYYQPVVGGPFVPWNPVGNFR